MNEVFLKIKQEGYIAGWDDTGGKCPYPDGSEEEICWLIGYNEALIDYDNSFDL